MMDKNDSDCVNWVGRMYPFQLDGLKEAGDPLRPSIGSLERDLAKRIRTHPSDARPMDAHRTTIDQECPPGGGPSNSLQGKGASKASKGSRAHRVQFCGLRGWNCGNLLCCEYRLQSRLYEFEANASWAVGWTLAGDEPRKPFSSSQAKVNPIFSGRLTTAQRDMSK
jgi:hypothetical protein